MGVLHSVKAIVCDVNGTMFSLAPLGERMHQEGLQETDLQVTSFAHVHRPFALMRMIV